MVSVPTVAPGFTVPKLFTFPVTVPSPWRLPPGRTLTVGETSAPFTKAVLAAATVVVPVAVKLPPVATLRTPALMLAGPVTLVAPLMTRVPAPALVRLPALVTAPLKTAPAALFTVTVGAVPVKARPLEIVSSPAPLLTVRPGSPARVRVLAPPMVTAAVSLIVRLLIVKSAPSVVLWFAAPVAEKVMLSAREGMSSAGVPARSLAQFVTSVHAPSVAPSQCVGAPATPGASGVRPMELVSMVTAPFRASARPSKVAPVLNVMEVIAMMVPTRDELTPSVAELPTTQKMFPA